MLRLAFLIMTVPGLALAQGFKHREKSPDAPPLPVIENYCTDATGARRELGEVICITASCQTWLALCVMTLNNPSWRKLQDGCPGAAAAPASPMERLKRLQPGPDPRLVDPAIPKAET